MNQQATKKIVSFDSIRYKEKFEGVSNLVTPHTGLEVPVPAATV
jgi:hypothetical protein